MRYPTRLVLLVVGHGIFVTLFVLRSSGYSQVRELLHHAGATVEQIWGLLSC